MSGLILIVEDEPDLVSNIEYNLEKEGYQTRTAMNGQAALDQAAQEPTPDLILLDLMLPDIPGTEVCRQIRMNERTRHIPIIMLTAKTDEIDRVVGFEVGADDYVAKPFSVREVLLRVRAILRRTQQAEPQEDSQLTFGRVRLDPAAHQAWVDEEELQLTALEFKLLNLLMARKGRVQSRDRLLNDVWGIHADVTTRTVDTHVKRLRQKLGEAASYIETLRGVGYRFRARPDDEDEA